MKAVTDGQQLLLSCFMQTCVAYPLPCSANSVLTHFIQISKPGRFFVASFPAEECNGFDLGRGEMCYAFNDAVLCTRKREGDKMLEVVAELPTSSCCEVVSVPPTREPSPSLLRFRFGRGGLTMAGSPCQFKLTFRADEKVVVGTTVEQMGTWTLRTDLGLSDSVLP